jgi:hypothetical protein
MTEERKPFWAKCPKCAHCWAACYTPLPVDTFARLMKRATCPMCGETKGIAPTSGSHDPPKPGTVSDVPARLGSWLSSNDTGISSKAIATHMSGGTVRDGWGWGYPHDPDDLGRCLRLLELFPDWKPRMREMAARSPGWAGLVARWDEVAKSMADEVGISWEKGKSAPLTYDLMKTAIGEGYRADPTMECPFNEKGHLRSAHSKDAA